MGQAGPGFVSFLNPTVAGQGCLNAEPSMPGVMNECPKNAQERELHVISTSFVCVRHTNLQDLCPDRTHRIFHA